MCGIVSAVSSRNVVPVLLDGLKRLEYRGYDSAGMSVINGKLQRIRSVGRVAELEQQALLRRLSGEIGIAHTRWATHGPPSERNAHPHVSGGVSVVHNGIIENHDEIRAGLRAQGYVFVSDTDTEVIAHLVHSALEMGCSLFEAVQRSVRHLSGAYAIAVIHDADPSQLVVARRGAPLLLGLSDGENFAASDTSALIPVTQRIVYLEDGDCAVITTGGVRIADRKGRIAARAEHRSLLRSDAVELGAYRHYMQKEIFEQPAAVANTLELASTARTVTPNLLGARAEAVLHDTRNVLILACGTSFHAGLVARHWIEGIAGIPCNVEIASEFRYREPAVSPHTLIVTLSQSGETADTIAGLQHARDLGHASSLCICNVPESALVRASAMSVLTRAGPEIGVASTKAFTTQLASLAVLAMVLAKMRNRLPAAVETNLLDAMRRAPDDLREVLKLEPQIEAWAMRFAELEHALFLGRGVHYPIAMEGALKLKEISYIHAEAYAAGELKHGPLALVTREMPVVAVAPRDALLDKLRSNLQEVRARGGELFVFADSDTGIAEEPGIHVIRMPVRPASSGLLSPLLHTVPLQLLAYHTAVRRGTDVDKPRNLAKSVTVE
jgi:glucosamine--fructose-6-phosphate aminotransferase (isomerizing)